VALADFIAEALKLGPEAPQFDADAYLAGVHLELSRAIATARPRTSVTPAQTLVSFASTADGFVPEDGQLHFLAGVSGRGKTTALALAAAAAIARTPVRYPLFVHLDERVTWIELLRGAIGAPATVDDSALRAWFQRTPTLVVIDDWHRVSDAARARFEAILASFPRARCAILVAGGEAIVPPRVPGIQHLRLPPWSAHERDAIIDHALGSPSSASAWVRQRISPGLYELLVQPVLLAKFLEMVRRTRAGGTQLPRDLPELFNRLLAALLSSIHPDAVRHSAEVAAVCGILSRAPGPITLSAIAAALSASGVARDASLFADDLCAAGLWKRTGATFGFEHEIWRTYFLATSLQMAPAWSDPVALTAWIGSTALSELDQLLPFATGMIRTSALQRALLEATMHRDLRLYCLSLRTRATVDALATMPAFDRARYVLGELHAGYVGLIDRHFAALRSRLQPWCDGDGEEALRDDKPVVGHRLSRHYMSTGDHLRSDSTRLVGANLLLKQLTKLCEYRQLPPIGWIARERFRSLVYTIGGYDHLGEDYWLRTVASILEWGEDQLRATGAEDILFGGRSWYPGEDPPRLRMVVELGRDLLKAGLGDISLADLGLPGPDLPSSGGYFSNGYSPDRKLERISALYRAVTETYHALYEQYFLGLARHTQYAQFPARANVRILPDTPHSPTAIELWWETVATSADATPQVSAGAAPSRTRIRSLADQQQAECERLGRPFVTFWFSHGHAEWNAWKPAVTDEVRDMLQHDLRQMTDWLAGAT
jgi:hypothetical protein